MLWFKTPEKIYVKKGCLPFALEELKTVMNKKKAFIVTDEFLYENGYTKPVAEKLEEMEIEYTTFFNVMPDPTLECSKEGAQRMQEFKPDVIISELSENIDDGDIELAYQAIEEVGIPALAEAILD